MDFFSLPKEPSEDLLESLFSVFACLSNFLPRWARIKRHILAAEGFWCNMFMQSATLLSTLTCRSITHLLEHKRRTFCLADTEEIGRKHSDLIDEQFCSDQWTNACFEALFVFGEKKKNKKRLFKDLLTPQMGFHLRSSTQETKDLPVSKRANESFLAKRDIYACRISGTAFPISATSTSTFPSSLAIRALRVWVWPSEVRDRLFYTWTC